MSGLLGGGGGIFFDSHCMCHVYRVWDVHNKVEINKLEFPASVADIELSSDGKLLTVAYSNRVAFWNVDRYVCSSSYYIPSSSLYTQCGMYITSTSEASIIFCLILTGILKRSRRKVFVLVCKCL